MTTRSRVPVDGGKRLDGLVVAATAWFAVGLFSDGWAHLHRLPDSFWTVWHAVLYSGYAAIALLIVGATALRWPRSESWRQAIPRGYQASVAGAAVFGIGGLLDMSWHLAFGIEVGNDALLSPTHLLLGLGGALLATGPLRADLLRGDRSSRLADRWPMAMSVAAFLSLLTFFTMYADPYNPIIGARFSGLSDAIVFHGLLTMFLFSALVSGLLLVLIRRTVWPVGALPLILGLNATATELMHSLGPPQIQLTFIGVALATGLIGEILIRLLRPSADRPVALRALVTVVPMAFWILYFVGVLYVRGLGWSAMFMSGAVILCGVCGLLLSYVAIPPAGEAAPIGDAG